MAMELFANYPAAPLVAAQPAPVQAPATPPLVAPQPAQLSAFQQLAPAALGLIGSALGGGSTFAGGYAQGLQQSTRNRFAQYQQQLAAWRAQQQARARAAAQDLGERRLESDERRFGERLGYERERDASQMGYRRERDQAADAWRQQQFRYRTGRDAATDAWRQRQFEYQMGRDAAGDDWRWGQFDYQREQDQRNYDLAREKLGLGQANAARAEEIYQARQTAIMRMDPNLDPARVDAIARDDDAFLAFTGGVPGQTAPGGVPAAQVAKAQAGKASIDMARDNLARIQTLFDEHGTEMSGPVSAQYEALTLGVIPGLQAMVDSGTLNQGEFETFVDTIGSLTSMGGALTMNSTIAAKLKTVDEILARKGLDLADVAEGRVAGTTATQNRAAANARRRGVQAASGDPGVVDALVQQYAPPTVVQGNPSTTLASPPLVNWQR